MENALIVTTSKPAAIYTEILRAAKITYSTAHSAGEARRMFLDQDFDLVIVDAPLSDESGENISRQIASKNITQVILAVNSEHFNAISAVCEPDGVLTISKPVSMEIFWTALSLAKAANNKIKRFQAENVKLKQKIDDIKIIDRAKCLLISYVNLSEQEAHRFIEKQAMDLRSSKVSIAQEIIKTYGS